MKNNNQKKEYNFTVKYRVLDVKLHAYIWRSAVPEW